MGGARRGPNAGPTFHESDIVAVDTAITVDNLDTSKAHCFVGIQLYQDENGDAKAEAVTAGEIVFEIETWVNEGYPESPPDDTIDCTAPSTLSWAANTVRLTGTPSGILGDATHWQVRVMQNET